MKTLEIASIGFLVLTFAGFAAIHADDGFGDVENQTEDAPAPARLVITHAHRAVHPNVRRETRVLESDGAVLEATDPVLRADPFAEGGAGFRTCTAGRNPGCGEGEGGKGAQKEGEG